MFFFRKMFAGLLLPFFLALSFALPFLLFRHLTMSYINSDVSSEGESEDDEFYEPPSQAKVTLPDPKKGEVQALGINELIDGNTTFLATAALKGNIPMVEYLLEHPDIDVNAKNKRGCTPIHNAFMHSRVAVIAILLSDGRADATALSTPPQPVRRKPRTHAALLKMNEPLPPAIQKSCLMLAFDANDAVMVRIAVLFAPHSYRQLTAQIFLTKRHEINRPSHGNPTPSVMASMKFNRSISLEYPDVNNGKNILLHLDLPRRRKEIMKTHGKHRAENIVYRPLFQMFAAEIFALIIFISDEYYTLIPNEIDKNVILEGYHFSSEELVKRAEEHKKFFRISKKLPMELQMRLASLACGINQSYIPKDWRGRALKKFTRTALGENAKAKEAA